VWSCLCSVRNVDKFKVLSHGVMVLRCPTRHFYRLIFWWELRTDSVVPIKNRTSKYHQVRLLFEWMVFRIAVLMLSGMVRYIVSLSNLKLPKLWCSKVHFIVVEKVQLWYNINIFFKIIFIPFFFDLYAVTLKISDSEYEINMILIIFLLYHILVGHIQGRCDREI
jgi:hypothetical protein